MTSADHNPTVAATVRLSLKVAVRRLGRGAQTSRHERAQIARLSQIARRAQMLRLEELPGRLRSLSTVGVLFVLAATAGVLPSGSGVFAEDSSPTAAAPSGPGETNGAQPALQPVASLSGADARQVLQTYCSDCHGGSASEAGLNFDAFTDLASMRRDVETWSKTRQMLDFRAMPPQDSAQPTDAERLALMHWIDLEVLQMDCNQPTDPGRVTIHRLNRLEYNHTVRDLWGLADYSPADKFPSDEVGGGFDNNADVLSLPPLLLEKYLSAAEETASRVIGIPREEGVAEQVRTAEQLTADGQVNRNGNLWTFGSDGELGAEVELSEEGAYRLQVTAGADQAGPELARMAVLVDGQVLGEFTVGATAEQLATYEIPARLSAGKHRISVRFTNDFWNPNEPDEEQRDRNLLVSQIACRGPWGESDRMPPLGRELLTIAQPSPGRPILQSLSEALLPVLQRTFRRPVESSEVSPYVELVVGALEHGDTLEEGLRGAITATLVSPHFLYRVEEDAAWSRMSPPYPLNNYHLASRLSYFLWSSMPDEDLLSAAAAGQLSTREGRAKQVQRMLQDPKAQALVQSFAHQWLNLRLLHDISPDPTQFPQFTDAMRRDMLRETELFFEEVMREDHSLLEFITGKYTYVNQRLAEVYGLSGIKGEEFQRVSLEGQPRAGVITQPSILLLTSNPTRTSPVKRGKWIMENILGTPPPEPPPNVPTLEESAKNMPNLSFREQMELHRASPVCASCHHQMDAIGFAFEHFDLLGRWRDDIAGHAIEAGGELPTGETFQGSEDLVQILAQRGRMFATATTRKMLGFALGRGLTYRDQCTVEEIVHQLQEHDYRFSQLILGVVESRPFLYRNAVEGE